MDLRRCNTVTLNPAITVTLKSNLTLINELLYAYCAELVTVTCMSGKPVDSGVARGGHGGHGPTQTFGG